MKRRAFLGHIRALMAPVALITVFPRIWGQNGPDTRVWGQNGEDLYHDMDMVEFAREMLGYELTPWQIAQYRAFGKTTWQYRLIEPILTENTTKTTFYAYS